MTWTTCALRDLSQNCGKKNPKSDLQRLIAAINEKLGVRSAESGTRRVIRQPA
jgi:hypothetical protein